MYTILETKRFCKSLKKISCTKGGSKIVKELKDCLLILAEGNKLDPSYRDHALKGEFEGYRECHIRGDVLLVYNIEKDKMILVLVEIGSHSYFFSYLAIPRFFPPKSLKMEFYNLKLRSIYSTLKKP